MSQECDEVIHLIPEKTVHQRVPLKSSEKSTPAPSFPSVPATPPHGIQSVQSNIFQSQLDATIHEQRVTHMQFQAIHTKPELAPDRLIPSNSSENVTEVQDDYFEEYYDEVP